MPIIESKKRKRIRKLVKEGKWAIDPSIMDYHPVGCPIPPYCLNCAIEMNYVGNDLDLYRCPECGEEVCL